MKTITKTIGIFTLLFLLIGITTIPFLTQDVNHQVMSVSVTKESVVTTVASSDSDIQAIWNRTWGGESGDRGSSVWGDGTYLYTAGTTQSFGAGYSSDLVLIKWDANGNILWNRTWGGESGDRGSSVWGDGTYLYTAGTTQSFGTGYTDLVLIKWDANGNILWEYTWGGGDYDYGSSVWGDGTYLYTAGTTQSFGAGYSSDLVLIKWDANGDILWEYIWDGGSRDCGNSVWGDGTYLYTAGETRSFETGYYDLVLIKWDVNGNILWNRTWSGGDDDYGSSVWGDGTYLYTAGDTRSFGTSGYDLVLIKWDANGNILWDRTWGGGDNDYGNSVWGDETYLYTTGDTWSFGAGKSDLVLIKWSSDTTVPVIPDDIPPDDTPPDDTPPDDIPPDDTTPDDTTPDDTTPDLDIGIIILLILISLIGAAGVAAIIIFLKLKRRQKH
ncbi:MAG: hypothetical protein ACKKMV_00990 [Candidatus Nealsonbacteria bacterium]